MRNYKIDILRGVSILLVLVHHFNIPYKLHDTFLGIPIGGESLSTLIARNGNYGVTMFFVISGFLITQHTLQRSGSLAQIKLKDFYIRRIARIMPCLVLLVAIVTVLGALELKPFMNQSPNGVDVSYAVTVLSAFSFWMNILIIEFGWVNYALGVLWSLSVEEVFYLAFPILCLVLGRGKGFIIFLLVVIAYAPYFRALHFGEESGAYLYHYFSSFDGIAIGSLTAIYVQSFKSVIRNQNVILAVIIFLMTCLYFYAPIKEVSTWGISVFALLTALLLFCFVQDPKVKPVSYAARSLVWIGQRSYEMYLFHLIVLGLMKVVYFPKETLAAEKLMLLPVYFIAVFMMSWAIEKYYSTPLNLKIRQAWIR
ncbi:acyltransferase [Acinetobacter sp. ACNIH2]|uniref:acyltransferase family protein n=1 Tax=Acinetobacter sp. ACNIH2 TaxID=1758189 RepID=UPI0005CD3395|nr:acyltransferase [Acinetobacter sp. ACNIH2]AUX86368.1 acyltransferase [Acinetobacter sp. ACNIH2]